MKQPKPEIKAANVAARRVRKALAEIAEAHRERQYPNGINWSVVEEEQYLAAELERIADRMLGRGEYATVAKINDLLQRERDAKEVRRG